VTILSTPPGALILLDDVSRGVTPWTGEIASGPHRITLRARGFEDSVHTFDMSARHAMDLTYELRPVVSPPPGAVATASSAGSAMVASSAAAPYETLPEDSYEQGVRWWTWTGLGATAALLVGSGVLELSRRELEDDAGRPQNNQLAADRKWQAMDDRKTAARVLLGIGAAVGVLSGVSLYLDLDASRSESTELGLACTGGDCQLVARETW
jgi:hypothetical protein